MSIFMRQGSRLGLSAAAAVSAIAIAACGSSSSSGGSSNSGGGSSSSSSGSSGSSTGSSGSASSNKSFTVAVSVPQEVDPYFIAITNYFKKEAQAHGMKVLAENANGSVAAQVDQIRTFVSDGVSAIAIDSINDQTIVPAIKFANQHNIPVFTIDTAPFANAMQAEGAHVVQTVESDNYQCGTTTATEMVEWLHGRPATVGKVILPLAQSTVTRDNAMQAVIKSHPNVHVVATVNGQATYDVALNATEQMLAGNPNIDVVWGTDGPGGTGALRAVIEKNLVGKVHVFANATVVPADVGIESGAVYVAGATQFPSVEGATTAYDMWRYLNGQHVQTGVEYTPCNAVTHSNAAKVTAYNEAVFGGSGNEPIQIELNNKFYEPQASGKLTPVTLP